MGRIDVIGTSHISEQSVRNLRQKIHLDRPDIVAVELDIVRLQELLRPQHKKRRVSIKDISNLGFFGWLFTIIGSFVQRRLGKRVGAKPGSDMKAAVLAAKEVGAQVVLIDRNIGVTVRRLSKNVPLREKLYLAWFLLFGWILDRKELSKLRKLDLKKVPSATLVREMITDFRHKFPHIYKVLVAERDKYMASRIKLVKNRFPKANIFVVVGAGHVKGLKKVLEHNNK